MALIKCKECGKNVSDSVTTCPKCGYDIQAQIKEEKEKLTTIMCPKCFKNVNKYLDKCPHCGEDLSKAKAFDKQVGIITMVILAVIVIGVVWFVIAVLNEPESEESKQEREKYIECYNRSDTYFKCDWATLEDRCVCKLR